MSNPDFTSVSQEHYPLIQKHAREALQKANCWGLLPTRIDQVMVAAQVVVSGEDVLNETFLSKLRYKAGSALKSALAKVLGVLDAAARIVYIDCSLVTVKQDFLKLHEAAHAVLPWQRDIYKAFEDCEKTLAPEWSEVFDQEANAFASEVLFQVDLFTNEASDHNFGVKVPLSLSKKYGASVYATVRRYVSTHHRNCTVLVLNPTVLNPNDGFTASLRRTVSSPSFQAMFGNLKWKTTFTPDDEIGKIIPMGNRRMSGVRTLSLTDINGQRHEVSVEAFKNTYQTFILILETKTLSSLISVCRPS